MAIDMNVWLAEGRLGRDPELRNAGGNSVVNFSIAVSDEEKKNGEKVDITLWADCVAWGKTAEAIANYVKKGDKIKVSGKWRTRKWTDQSGAERKSNEVLLDRFWFGEKANRDSGQNGTTRQQQDFRGPGARQGGGIQSAGNWGAPDGDVDDIPFGPCVD